MLALLFFVPSLPDETIQSRVARHPVLSGTLVSRLPRRVVGHHGEPRLCRACVKEDVNAFGMGYWHRAHHLPGVGYVGDTAGACCRVAVHVANPSSFAHACCVNRRTLATVAGT